MYNEITNKLGGAKVNTLIKKIGVDTDDGSIQSFCGDTDLFAFCDSASLVCKTFNQHRHQMMTIYDNMNGIIDTLTPPYQTIIDTARDIPTGTVRAINLIVPTNSALEGDANTTLISAGRAEASAAQMGRSAFSDITKGKIF